jgi:hypothetical protein
VKIADRILIIVIILGALFLFGMQVHLPAAANYAVVTQNGVVLKEIECAKDEIINLPLNNGTMRLETKGGGMRVIDSTCPEQICVHSGWIRKPGQSIICVPNQIVVELKGSQAAEYDGLAY